MNAKTDTISESQCYDDSDRLIVEAIILERYQALEAMMAIGSPPEKIAHFLYWPDVVVAGEGLGRVYRGLDDLSPMFTAVVSQELSKDCSWTMTDSMIHSGNVAAVFTQVTSRYGAEKPDANFCALYVWEKRGSDWKVAREQVCNGMMR